MGGGSGGGIGSGFEPAKVLVRRLRPSRAVQVNYLVAVRREWADCAAVTGCGGSATACR